MNDFHEPISEEQLDNYLEGTFSGVELEQFEARLAHDPRAQQLVALQRQFEAQLRGSFVPPACTIAQVENWLGEPVTAPDPPRDRRRWSVIALAVVAASMAWLVLGIRWHGGRQIEPFFEQRPLAAIYQETVDRGFQPYYFCEDEERFALTFQQRQHVRLVLKATPADRRMVGLSYLGGLSRDTTAILCYVSDQPVVVFVDRLEVDNPALAMAGDSPVRVHRSELGNLVLYEVSPFDTAKMTGFLQTAL